MPTPTPTGLDALVESQRYDGKPHDWCLYCNLGSLSRGHTVEQHESSIAVVHEAANVNRARARAEHAAARSRKAASR